MTGSKVTAILRNEWILPIGGVASRRVYVQPAKQACFLFILLTSLKRRRPQPGNHILMNKMVYLLIFFFFKFWVLVLLSPHDQRFSVPHFFLLMLENHPLVKKTHNRLSLKNVGSQFCFFVIVFQTHGDISVWVTGKVCPVAHFVRLLDHSLFGN